MCCMASTSGTTLCCLMSICWMGCWSSSFLVAIAFRISICGGWPARCLHEFSVVQLRRVCSFRRSRVAAYTPPHVSLHGPPLSLLGACHCVLYSACHPCPCLGAGWPPYCQPSGG